MIKEYESVSYNTLDELQATYKSNHPDVLRLIKLYGNDIKFSHIMYPKNVIPRFEMICYKVVKCKGVWI